MSNLGHVTDANFESEVLKSDTLTIVDFWAEWCGPCRALGKTLEQVAAEAGDKVRILKLNIEENGQIAAQFNVTNIPLMVFFKDGQKVDQLLGNQPKQKIMAAINANA